MKDIIKFSNYRPEDGDLLKLYELIEEGKTGIELQEQFSSRSQYYVLFNNLKKGILDGMLTKEQTKLNRLQKKYFDIRKLWLQGVTLLDNGDRKEAIALLKSCYSKAKKYQLFDIGWDISNKLSYYFAFVRNRLLWKKYERECNYCKNAIIEETTIRQLYSELVISTQFKEDVDDLMDKVVFNESNTNYRYRLYYYSFLKLYYQYLNDTPNRVAVCEEALTFFDTLDIELPYIYKYTFLIQLVQINLATNNFAKCEASINQALPWISKGTNNWFNALIIKSMLGFYAHKTDMAYQCYVELSSTRKRFIDLKIDERIEILRAYLYFFEAEKMEQLHGKFRLGRFKNQLNKFRIQGFIIELIYLFVNDKRDKYVKRCEQIENMIHAHKPNKRTKFFLRILKIVGFDNFKKITIEKRAKRIRYLFSKTKLGCEFDTEPVPFDSLLEMVFKKL